MGFENAMPYFAAAEAIGNPLLGHLTNVKNRKFTREMYKTQRQDALADWHMQNKYNSPREQMQRFQEAGLNPNLIYGQMTEAGGVRSSSASGGSGEAPRIDTSGKFMEYYNIKQAKAQTDNLTEVNENLRVERDLKRAQIASTIMSTSMTEVQKQKLLFDLGIETDLRDTTIEGRKAAVEKTKSEIMQSWNEDARRTLMTMQNVDESVARIGNMAIQNAKSQKEVERINQEIINMKKDGTLKDFDIAWRKAGHNPGDPTVVKIWDEIWNRITSFLPKGELGTLPWQGESYDSKRRSHGKFGEVVWPWQKK